MFKKSCQLCITRICTDVVGTSPIEHPPSSALSHHTLFTKILTLVTTGDKCFGLVDWSEWNTIGKEEEAMSAVIPTQVTSCYRLHVSELVTLVSCGNGY
jgi:hypothetical protein